MLILKTRLLILPNTRRPFKRMRRTNTAQNIDVSRPLNLKAYQTTIMSPPQWFLDLVNLFMIIMICPAIMKNTASLKMWLKRHLHESIVQRADWSPQGSIWTHLVNYHRTWGKWIRILMITTPTQWRSVVHFGYQISPTGGSRKKQCTQSAPISPMWHATYSLSYLLVSDGRLSFPLGEMQSDRGRQEPHTRSFAKWS